MFINIALFVIGVVCVAKLLIAYADKLDEYYSYREEHETW